MTSKRILSILIGFILMYAIESVGAQSTATPDQILFHPPSTILDIAYSPNGEYLAQIYASGLFEVVEIIDQQTVVRHTPELLYSLWSAQAAWSLGGDQIAVAIGSNIYLWDIESNQQLQTISAGGREELVYFEAGYYIPEGFVSLQWNKTGTLLMAKSISSRHTVWSFDEEKFIVDRTFGNNPIRVVWTSDEKGITGQDVYLDIETQEFVISRPQRIDFVTNSCGMTTSIASNAARTLVTSGTSNGCIYISDTATGNQVAAYKITYHSIAVHDVSWSLDERLIIAVDDSGAVKVIDIATGKVALIDNQDGALYAVDWSDIDTQIAYGGLSLQETSLFATISVDQVEMLMTSDAAQKAEMAVTPPAQLD